MKISSIGNNFCCNKMQKQQSFKGLWGKTERENEWNRQYEVNIDTDVMDYYPFLNETQEEIASVVSQKESTEHFPSGRQDRFDYEYNVKVKVNEPLRFTKEEYFGFKNNPASLSDEQYGRVARVMDRVVITETPPEL